ncbi:Unknown protein sequence [Pseudomonas savastanoi pv. phaseolicola]|nr:Unknown protein sequence [Pseudomonas savastanoi pv. phaseolicola]
MSGIIMAMPVWRTGPYRHFDHDFTLTRIISLLSCGLEQR